MTVTLNLEPELEAGLLAKAQSSGMDVEHYLQALIKQQFDLTALTEATEETARAEAVRRMLEFGDKYRLQFGEPVTRQSMHDGHRF